ncbi:MULTISPECIES: head GIN domain-containing protein [Porphyromonadaceae]|nr:MULTISPECIES: head GIN domain-containing protein [Porphyromonadaceae]
MMKGLLWGLCFLLFAVSGWAKDKKVTGTGYVLMSQRPSEVRFEKISVQQGITLYVTLDKTATISVESDDNILPYIKTEIKNNQLNVYIEPGISIRRYTVMNVLVTLPRLVRLEAASAARIEGSALLRVDQLEVVASGASNMKLEVKGNELQVEASGASRLELKGEVKQLDLNLSTASYLKAWELSADTCNADISNAAKGEIFVRQKLNAEISSSGLLLYDGSPVITRNLSSGGSLVKRR